MIGHRALDDARATPGRRACGFWLAGVARCFGTVAGDGKEGVPLREALIGRCLARAWRSTPERVKGWLPEDDLRAALAAPVVEAVDRVRDRWTPPQVRDSVPVPGTAPEDYGYGAVAVGDEGTFIGGIRFRSGDFSARFVEVYARDFFIENRSTLAAIRDAAREAFKVFSPAAVRVHLGVGGEEERVVSGFGVATEYFTVAGPVCALQRLVPPPGVERVRLEAPRSSSFYKRYLQAYRDVHADRPELEGLVDPEPLEDLERYIEEGFFYEAYVDGRWAGVICAEKSRLYGAHDFEVVEEILAARFRGRGLAPALQRRLIDALPADRNAILYGTIDAPNAPSLATARRVGRTDVMVSRFVDL